VSMYTVRMHTDLWICVLHRFTFDHVYDQASSQEQVYMRSAQHVVLSILQVGRWIDTSHISHQRDTATSNDAGQLPVTCRGPMLLTWVFKHWGSDSGGISAASAGMIVALSAAWSQHVQQLLL
jgi:hypothetical protein